MTSIGVTLAEAIELWRELRDVRPASERTYDTLVRLCIEPSSAGARCASSTTPPSSLRMGAAGANPVRQLDKRDRPRQGPSRRRILSRDEEAYLLAYCARSPWLRPIVTVALHEALPLGEVLALEWSDVDYAAGTLHVRRALDHCRNIGPCKGQSREDFERGEGARIELTPAAREALLEPRLEAAGDAVFVNRAGGRRTIGDVQRAFRTRANGLPCPRRKRARSSFTRSAIPASAAPPTTPRSRSSTSAISPATPTWRRRRATFTRSTRRPSARRSPGSPLVPRRYPSTV